MGSGACSPLFLNMRSTSDPKYNGYEMAVEYMPISAYEVVVRPEIDGRGDAMCLLFGFFLASVVQYSFDKSRFC